MSVVWTPREDELLRVNSSLSEFEIWKLLDKKRTGSAIYGRKRQLGLIPKRKPTLKLLGTK